LKKNNCGILLSPCLKQLIIFTPKAGKLEIYALKIYSSAKMDQLKSPVLNHGHYKSQITRKASRNKSLISVSLYLLST
jgi:hypothetical protein